MSCMQCVLGHVECRDDGVCTEDYTTMELEAITQSNTGCTAIEHQLTRENGCEDGDVGVSFLERLQVPSLSW